MVSAMWGGEWEIRWFDDIDSTNTYVRGAARHGAPEGLVVVADHQTAGRGRLDRRWESPPGANLLASVLLRPECGQREVHLCTAAVALAAADACMEVAGVEPVVKWPNDLLAGPAQAKLAGVLAEAEFAGSTLAAVVVGIGLNVAWPGPDGAGGTCLDDLRRLAEAAAEPTDRRRLLERLLAGLAPRRALLDDEDGRQRLAGELRRRCATLGRTVRVVLASEEFTGRAEGIDEAGQLVVETPDGSRLVSVGDVVHLRPA
jgi:BirA family transcriptional regulator, biotin operon repressor / biotin---[acetyl-CoA-carboxylase] ligase